MTRLVLHIGDPKTGTSSIQTALFERRLACPTVQLVSPPELSEAKLAATLFVPARSKDRATLMRKKARWLEEIDADIAVLSAEQFSHVKPYVMRNALAKFLPLHTGNTRILAYVRPHAQRVLSAYAQQTKCGVSVKSQEGFHDTTLTNRDFIYSDRFEEWRTIFGERFTLRPMIRKCLKDGDVTHDFFDVVLDGAPFELETSETVNESLSLQQLACVREIQIVLRKEDVRNQVRVAIGSHFGMVLNADSSASSGEKIRLHRDLAEKIILDYKADAAQLDKTFFDAPLMQDSLAEAIEGAIASPQPHELKHHTTSAQRGLLRSTADALAKALHHDGTGWKRSRLKAIGQNPKKLPETPEELASLAQVEAILDDLIGQIKTICA